jgi:hypothetical protein
LSVDLVLDHKLGENEPPLDHSFGPLRLTADLKKPALSGVRWGERELPDRSAPSAAVEDVLQVRVTGLLSEESSEWIRGADRLLSDDIMTSLAGLWRMDLANQSHYGISLGWLGYEHLRHGLMFTGGEEGPFAFQYTVGGAAFPLTLVRRQLEEEGWPLVLRGTEYLGSSEEGIHVFQPVEWRFLREPAEQPGK